MKNSAKHFFIVSGVTFAVFFMEALYTTIMVFWKAETLNFHGTQSKKIGLCQKEKT